MLINGKRALAYIVAIDEIRPIPNYDRVEHARTNGWWVIVSKNDNLNVGDKCESSTDIFNVLIRSP